MANDFNSKYKDLMENISIDEEMRSRVLANVAASASKTDSKKRKMTPAKVTRLISTIAAAAIVLVIGGVVLNLASSSNKKSETATHHAGHQEDKVQTGMPPLSEDAACDEEVMFEPTTTLPANGGAAETTRRDDSDAEAEVDVEGEETESVNDNYISISTGEVGIACFDQEGIDAFMTLLNEALGQQVSADEFVAAPGSLSFHASIDGDFNVIRISDTHILIGNDCYVIAEGYETIESDLIEIICDYGG